MERIMDTDILFLVCRKNMNWNGSVLVRILILSAALCILSSGTLSVMGSSSSAWAAGYGPILFGILTHKNPQNPLPFRKSLPYISISIYQTWVVFEINVFQTCILIQNNYFVFVFKYSTKTNILYLYFLFCVSMYFSF